ncbi:hypothetical protein STCU_10080 [Strigomonas culicis]|uniref:Treble clef zinc finger domain-containing protein n=1 Tax=Strigomonas culicis TaxID=28005 RepID=S9TPA0_9TRYP|nr:hypothetical protein STCU_10080 [Strigomonas culicis]|eukprot:EPY18278.1 hypothetical protein STCU_10080 [Strigomonas culicis]
MDVKDILIDNASVVKWNCVACGEQWRCAVFVRCILKNGCPSCYAKKHPSLAAVRPDLVRLWDAAANSPFDTPDRVPADSRMAASWKCAQCGNSYRAKVKDRVLEKNKCPSCELMNLKSANDLAQEEGALLQEWHPLKNGDLSLDQVQPTDQKTQLWWLCSVCGHDWQATLATRLSRRKKVGKNCPVCQRKTAAH